MKFKEYKILNIKTLQTTFFKLCVKKIMINFSSLGSHVFAIWKLKKIICRLKDKNFNYSNNKILSSNCKDERNWMDQIRISKAEIQAL